MVDQNRRGGIQSRIGNRFHTAIEKIKDERLKKGKDKERMSTEKITNLIVKHKEAWGEIEKDIINLEGEEIDKLWE